MNSARHIDDHASKLLRRALQETTGSAWRTRFEEALSAGWYLVAADAVSGIAEQERPAMPNATPTSGPRFPRFERHQRPTGRAD